MSAFLHLFNIGSKLTLSLAPYNDESLFKLSAPSSFEFETFHNYCTLVRLYQFFFVFCCVFFPPQRHLRLKNI